MRLGFFVSRTITVFVPSTCRTVNTRRLIQLVFSLSTPTVHGVIYSTFVFFLVFVLLELYRWFFFLNGILGIRRARNFVTRFVNLFPSFHIPTYFFLLSIVCRYTYFWIAHNFIRCSELEIETWKYFMRDCLPSPDPSETCRPFLHDFHLQFLMSDITLILK